VSGDADLKSVQFEPLQPASRTRLVLAIVFGPVLWLVALIVTAIVVHRSWAIELGLVVTAVSFLVALVVLTLLHAGRHREERRYVDGG
jgi:membrane protein implicated in regulation of membrane protease activity